MAYIDLKKKQVQIKIVYVGPGRGGKTTNLEYIFSKIKDRTVSEMVRVKTHGDRTLFFDFLPFELGEIRGFKIKAQLYTVPGQVKYNATRRLVLKGVDGIVFVADSLNVMRKKNVLALKDLEENLSFHRIDLYDGFPVVMQYNKRDLSNRNIPILDIKTLQNDLNKRLKAPWFEASATKGNNIIPTVKKAISLTVASIQEQIG